MSLSCYCDDEFEWWYEARDVRPLATKRWRTCCSCGARIKPGDDAMELRRWRHPEPDSVAERIYGCEEPMSSRWLCDRCAGLYESLTSLGFCLPMPEHGPFDLRDLCREYADMQRDAGIFRGSMVIDGRREP